MLESLYRRPASGHDRGLICGRVAEILETVRCCHALGHAPCRPCPPAAEIADRVMDRALEKGLSFKTTMGDVLT